MAAQAASSEVPFTLPVREPSGLAGVRATLLKAAQLRFGFEPAREPVQRPGLRGGKGYYNDAGVWQYGERPQPRSVQGAIDQLLTQAARPEDTHLADQALSRAEIRERGYVPMQKTTDADHLGYRIVGWLHPGPKGFDAVIWEYVPQRDDLPRYTAESNAQADAVEAAIGFAPDIDLLRQRQEAGIAPAPDGPVGDPKTAAKLRKAAASLTAQIAAKRDPAIGHQNITARRARIAAGMHEDADRLEQQQSALEHLADAYEAGTVPPVLRGITTRIQIEMLLHPYERYPEPHMDVQRLDEFLGLVGDTPDLAEHLPTLRTARAAADPSESDWVVLTPDQATAAIAVFNYDRKHPRTNEHGHREQLFPWAVDSLRAARRFLGTGVVDEATFEEAKAAMLALAGARREDPQAKIRALERNLLGTKLPGYFPTPRALAERAVEAATLAPGMRVLEPSAGKGDLADVIRADCPDCTIDTVEIASSLREVLAAKGYTPIGYDLFDIDPPELYDRVVMNPPFEHGADMEHVQRAFELLKPGGRLVAIVSEGTHFREDRKARDFRAWLDARGGISEPNPEGSFARHETSDRTTGVRTRLVVVDKDEIVKAGLLRRAWDFVKSQLAFDFSGAPDTPRKPVQKPGSRGGKGYYDKQGDWQYGTAPAGAPKTGVAWLHQDALDRCAKYQAELDAIEADTSSPAQRVGKYRAGSWWVRQRGRDDRFPTTFPTKREALDMAERNGTAAPENTVRLLDEAKQARDEYAAKLPATSKAAKKTQAFRRWFGASRVVDAAGDPAENYGTAKKVYHGTAHGGFRRFRKDKIGRYNIYGPGFYFTEDREMAEEYTDKDSTDNYAGLDTAEGFLQLGKRESGNLARTGAADRRGAARVTHLSPAFVRAYVDEQQHGTNGAWDGGLRAVCAELRTADGVDLRAFIRRTERPIDYQIDGTDHVFHTEVSSLQQGIRHVLRQAGIVPVQTPAEVKEVYLAIENPADMDDPATPEEIEALVTFMAQADRESRLVWARKRATETWDQDKRKAELAALEKAPLGPWSPYLDDLASDDAMRGAGYRLGDLQNPWVPTYDGILKIKQLLRPMNYVDSRDGTGEARPSHPLLRRSPADTLTRGDVQYILTNGQHHEVSAFTDFYKSQGHDGIRHMGGFNLIGPHPRDHVVWIAFEPNQIKATTAAEFDPASDDIYKGDLFDGVQQPGSRGGKGYYDEEGQWRYGARPAHLDYLRVPEQVTGPQRGAIGTAHVTPGFAFTTPPAAERSKTLIFGKPAPRPATWRDRHGRLRTDPQPIRTARVPDRALLVAAAEANHSIQMHRAQARPGSFEAVTMSSEALQRNPPVRVRFEHFTVIGTPRDAASWGKHKTAWGEWMAIEPLDPDDYVHPMRVTGFHHGSNPHQEAYDHRRALKKKLGRKYAKLVGQAMRSSRTDFLGRRAGQVAHQTPSGLVTQMHAPGISDEESRAIVDKLQLTPSQFWQQVHAGPAADTGQGALALKGFELGYARAILKAAPELQRDVRRGHLADAEAATVEDLVCLDDEDLPALEDRDDASAVLAKAQLLNLRAAFVDRLARIARARQRLDRAEVQDRVRLTPLALVEHLEPHLKARTIKRPGSRGGHGYYTDDGAWRYGERPKPGHLRFEEIPLSVQLRRQKAIAFRHAVVRGPEDIAEAYRAITDHDRERLCSVALNEQGRILAIETISVGTIDASIAGARETFKVPVALGATRLALIHNHPSGHPFPSGADKEMLAKMRLTGRGLGIEVDGIVVGREGWQEIGKGGQRSYRGVGGRHRPLMVDGAYLHLDAPGPQITEPRHLVQVAQSVCKPEDRSLFAVFIDSKARIRGVHPLVIDAVEPPGGAAQDALLELAITHSAAAVFVVGGSDGRRWNAALPAWMQSANRALADAGIRMPDGLLIGEAHATSFKELFDGSVVKALVGLAGGADLAEGNAVLHGKDSIPTPPACVKAHPLQGAQRVDGLDIAIENRVGSLRHWRDHDGTEGATKMRHAYGYVRQTLGVDGDQLDVFLGPLARRGEMAGSTVYLVTTCKPPRFEEIDEQKAMVGFESKRQAERAFRAHYDDPRFVGTIDAIGWEDFKEQALATAPGATFLLGQRVPEESMKAFLFKADPPAQAGALQFGKPEPAPLSPADGGTIATHLAEYVPILQQAVGELAQAFPGVPIAGRICESAGLSSRIQERGEAPAEAAEDTVSVRLVLEKPDDTRLAMQRLRRQFQVTNEDAGTDSGRGLGYRGAHLTVTIEGRPIEVQLRTARQTAWADYAGTVAQRFGSKTPPEAQAYLRQMSDHFGARDGGAEAAAPDAPESLARMLGPMGEPEAFGAAAGGPVLIVAVRDTETGTIPQLRELAENEQGNQGQGLLEQLRQQYPPPRYVTALGAAASLEAFTQIYPVFGRNAAESTAPDGAPEEEETKDGDQSATAGNRAAAQPAGGRQEG